MTQSTSSQFQKTVSQFSTDKSPFLSNSRCEVCSERKFALSGSLVQLSDIGNILKIFHLKATKAADNTLIKFAEEFQEKNIHNIANEFLIRIEKIGAYDPNALDAEEEENIKNYFFPTRHKMLRYLHLVLEYAKPLIDADAKVLEVCYNFVAYTCRVRMSIFIF